MSQKIGLLVRFEIIWFLKVQVEQGWFCLLVVVFQMMYLLKLWL